MIDSYHYEKTDDFLKLWSKSPSKKRWFIGCLLAALLIAFTIWGMTVTLEPAETALERVGGIVFFWVVWIFLFLPTMLLLFDRSMIQLDRDGLLVVHRCLFLRSSRRVPLEEILDFDAILKEDSEGDEYYVKAVTSKKSVEIVMDNFQDAQRLADEMNQMLAELKGKNAP